MAESRFRPDVVSPQSRELRRVVRVNDDIGYQVRRIMGLKETDYHAMAILMRHPMGPTELARALHITSAAATAVVDRLVRAGHAVREPHPDDRRRMIIRAVDASRATTMEHVYPMMSMVEEELEKLDERGRAAVLSFLTGTAASMESYRDELRDRPARAAQPADPGEPLATGEERA
ncbi:MarR family transcriptional regulator [Kocuria sp. cx-116]|uniref:MarR family winged helix-turn-helix transcriptional regulator n=1 Tax=Kocuria sp. cx-116 TaxID=2771378 RepID=UPI001687BFB1|nr:MarR family transcriptional regulator [Kocuria sp. cx-116]MBD2763093.1 MarR family transcriptional regulator [Kocuria sp. cx-116]